MLHISLKQCCIELRNSTSQCDHISKTLSTKVTIQRSFLSLVLADQSAKELKTDFRNKETASYSLPHNWSPLIICHRCSNAD